MPILNPDHLFDQADKLIVAPPAGPPRQVDLRRAVSSAYYALFHLTLTALADEVVGALYRNTKRYGLVHRAVDHRTIKDLCLTVSKAKPPIKYVPYVPTKGFGRDLLVFASAFVNLQDERHRADYDVTARCRTLDAKVVIAAGRSGMTHFRGVDGAERKVFLTMLLCPPR